MNPTRDQVFYAWLILFILAIICSSIQQTTAAAFLFAVGVIPMAYGYYTWGRKWRYTDDPPAATTN